MNYTYPPLTPDALALCAELDAGWAEYWGLVRSLGAEGRTLPEEAEAGRVALAGTDEEYAAASLAAEAAYEKHRARAGRLLDNGRAEESLALAALADALEECGDIRAAGLRLIRDDEVLRPEHGQRGVEWRSAGGTAGPAKAGSCWLAPAVFARLPGGFAVESIYPTRGYHSRHAAFLALAEALSGDHFR